MLDAEIEKIEHRFDSVNPRSPTRPVEKPVIVSFDTECGADNRLLSVQFHIYGGKPFIYILKPTGRSVKLDEQFFITKLKQYLKQCKIKTDKVYLLSHFIIAELRHMKYFWSKRWQKKEVGDSLHANIKLGGLKVRLVDSNLFFRESLEKAVKPLNLSKVSLDGVPVREPSPYGGYGWFAESEDFWKQNMDLLLAQHPRIFKKYALQDVVVLTELFHRWRDWFLTNYQVDLLRCRSLPNAMSEVFKTKFLNGLQLTSKNTVSKYKPQLSKGRTHSWRTRKKTVDLIAPPWLEVRDFALRCYHGGRGEASVFGNYERPTKAYDVSKMYTNISLTQPFPCETTKWRHRKNVQFKDIKNLEGFVHVSFKFSDKFLWPCLPVECEHPQNHVQLYPTEGQSFCTMEELRTGYDLDPILNGKILEAWVFKPTYNEITNHPVRRLVLDFKKKANSHDPFSVKVVKDSCNSFYGKFVQRTESDYEPIFYAGSLFSPEISALICGTGRAVLSRFQALGALVSATDGFVLPSDVKIPPNLRKMLRQRFMIQLNHKTEEDGGGLVAVRKGVYVPYTFTEERIPMPKFVRKGIHIDDRELEEYWLGRIFSPGWNPTTFQEYRIIKYHEVRQNKQLRPWFGFSRPNKRKFKWSYDMKRRPIRWPIDVAEAYTDTLPWKNQDQFYLSRDLKRQYDENKVDAPTAQTFLGKICQPLKMTASEFNRLQSEILNIRPVGRPVAIRQKERHKILKAYGTMTVRDAAKKFGVSKDTVSRIWRKTT